ncbi:MAG: hypothetical protein PHS64_00375 [Candidatus Omnitrophica bacterium]|nr:hypothetical protein [Candidatus Omnitrophota bacterium]
MNISIDVAISSLFGLGRLPSRLSLKAIVASFKLPLSAREGAIENSMTVVPPLIACTMPPRTMRCVSGVKLTRFRYCSNRFLSNNISLPAAPCSRVISKVVFGYE